MTGWMPSWRGGAAEACAEFAIDQCLRSAAAAAIVLQKRYNKGTRSLSLTADAVHRIATCE